MFTGLSDDKLGFNTQLNNNIWLCATVADLYCAFSHNYNEINANTFKIKLKTL